MIGLKKEKKKKTNVEKKETHVDNHGFDFWVEISTNYFFTLYMANKTSLFFWKKNQRCNICLYFTSRYENMLIYWAESLRGDMTFIISTWIPAQHFLAWVTC